MELELNEGHAGTTLEKVAGKTAIKKERTETGLEESWLKSLYSVKNLLFQYNRIRLESH